MKHEIEPYDEGSGDEEAQSGVNGFTVVDNDTQTSSIRICEVREYEAYYNLKGERDLKLVQDAKKKDTDSSAEDAAKYCMRSEKYFSRDGSIESRTLEIYSEQIQQALKKVIGKYPGINFYATPIILIGELRCVFHYRKELAKYRDESKDSITRLHVGLLLKFMQRELRAAIKAYEANVESSPEEPSIDFTHLWTVFKAGDLMVSGRSEKFQISELQRINYYGGAEPEWYVVGRVIDHDGQSYGYVESGTSIKPYMDNRPIHKLVIHPLKYHKEKDSAQVKMIARGKKFCSLVGCHYKSYVGIASAVGHQRKVGSYGQMDEFPLETAMINSRVMIDCKMFAIFKPPNRVILDDRMSVDPDLDDQSDAFSDEEFMICDSRVQGFALTNKRWCMFFVDYIRPVELNEKAFDDLLLPVDHKMLVHALVRTHSEDNGGFDDTIKGKGKGLIFCLHGPPGVGKTLTAESVADHLKRPLYILQSGELGVTPESVETNLNNALMLATTWKAVLLIDEADVFLEQRTVQDLTRNCLVSLFLRLLEYYEGILILTTNRIVTFDLAFKSRIHLALKYNDLDISQRTELWKLFIKRTPMAGGKEWPAEDLDELAKATLNGRQIKNAVRTANSLAMASDESLEQKHLRIVLKTLETFERDLNEDTQDSACLSPKMLKRQSTLMSRLSLLDGTMTQEPAPMEQS